MKKKTKQTYFVFFFFCFFSFFIFLPVCWVEETRHSSEAGDVVAVAAEEKATAAERAGGDVSRLKSWCHLSRDRPKSHEMYDVVTCQKFSKKKHRQKM